MSDAWYSRMARYAAFSAAHGVVVVAALSGVIGENAGLIVLIASVPLFFAWGHFQADVATNPTLDSTQRQRWRIVLWCFPWSATAYWYSQVRPRRPND